MPAVKGFASFNGNPLLFLKNPFSWEAVSQSWGSFFFVISTEGRNLLIELVEESRFLGWRLEMTLRHSLWWKGERPLTVLRGESF